MLGWGFSPESGLPQRKFQTLQGRTVGFANSMSARPKAWRPGQPLMASPIAQQPVQNAVSQNMPLGPVMPEWPYQGHGRRF